MFGSDAFTDATSAHFENVVVALSLSHRYVQLKTTSALEKAEPSDHLRPGFSFQVTVVRSFDTPPLTTVGISAARTATGLPSGPYAAIGSIIKRDASLSFVPPAWCGFRIVGACQ